MAPRGDGRRRYMPGDKRQQAKMQIWGPIYSWKHATTAMNRRSAQTARTRNSAPMRIVPQTSPDHREAAWEDATYDRAADRPPIISTSSRAADGVVCCATVAGAAPHKYRCRGFGPSPSTDALPCSGVGASALRPSMARCPWRSSAGRVSPSTATWPTVWSGSGRDHHQQPHARPPSDLVGPSPSTVRRPSSVWREAGGSFSFGASAAAAAAAATCPCGAQARSRPPLTVGA